MPSHSFVRTAVITVLVLAPQAAAAASLKDAMTHAYRTNPNLEAARRQLEATNEQVPQARSNWRPTVTVNLSAGIRRRAAESQRQTIESRFQPRTGTLEVEQPVYRGGSTFADTRRAKNAVRAERQRLAETRQEVLLRAVESYMNVWRDQAVLDLNKNNVEVLRERLKATRERFQVGEVTRTDVAQAESRLARARADRTAARSDLEASRARYAEVIGRAPSDLSLPDVPAKLPAARQTVVERARTRNPAVLAASYQAQAARDEVDRLVGQLFPQLNLVGRVQRSSQQTSQVSQTDTAEILAQLTVPIYQQGAVYSRIREAKQRANQRMLDLTAEKRAAKQEAVAAWEDLQAARSRIEARREQVKTAEIALEGVREENRVGERTILDILDQEQELLNAEVDLVRAKRDLIAASYRLLAAVGALTPSRAGLTADAYDAGKRYQAVDDKLFGADLPGKEDNDS